MEFYTWCVIAAAFGMAIGSFGTGLGQGIAISKAVEGVARNPGASGKIMTIMLIGLAMIESLAIYLEDAPGLNLHLLETCHLMVSEQMGPADAVRHLMTLPTLDD